MASPTTFRVHTHVIHTHARLQYQVNMIMDSFGALALATEAPSPELLQQKPHGRQARLITACMAKHILTQGLYQLFWMFLIL